MKLKEFLETIKDLESDLELYIHEIDDQDGVHFKPLKGINLQITDKKLSFGAIDFNQRMYEKLRDKGFYL